jgi:hypothetical protein
MKLLRYGIRKPLEHVLRAAWVHERTAITSESTLKHGLVGHGQKRRFS